MAVLRWLVVLACTPVFVLPSWDDAGSAYAAQIGAEWSTVIAAGRGGCRAAGSWPLQALRGGSGRGNERGRGRGGGGYHQASFVGKLSQGVSGTLDYLRDQGSWAPQHAQRDDPIGTPRHASGDGDGVRDGDVSESGATDEQAPRDPHDDKLTIRTPELFFYSNIVGRETPHPQTLSPTTLTLNPNPETRALSSAAASKQGTPRP